MRGAGEGVPGLAVRSGSGPPWPGASGLARSAPLSLPPSPSLPAGRRGGGGPPGLGWRRGYVTRGAPVSGRLGGGRGLSARGWGKAGDATAPRGLVRHLPPPAAAAAGAQEETALVGVEVGNVLVCVFNSSGVF